MLVIHRLGHLDESRILWMGKRGYVVGHQPLCLFPTFPSGYSLKGMGGDILQYIHSVTVPIGHVDTVS